MHEVDFHDDQLIYNTFLKQITMKFVIILTIVSLIYTN
jgi:hypothetical protein